ncbi:hypothetical protein RQP53_07010, partial [Paucibacter sp. APW11]|nr:hypothetical protein [Paucibacter sp. APW11]
MSEPGDDFDPNAVLQSFSERLRELDQPPDLTISLSALQARAAPRPARVADRERAARRWNMDDVTDVEDISDRPRATVVSGVHAPGESIAEPQPSTAAVPPTTKAPASDWLQAQQAARRRAELAAQQAKSLAAQQRREAARAERLAARQAADARRLEQQRLKRQTAQLRAELKAAALAQERAAAARLQSDVHR